MPSTDRLKEFAEIVASGSISAAARTLDLPRATLSRRLSALEGELAVRLLHRGTRKLVLTPAGEELHFRAQRVVADANAAWDAVRRLDGVPRGLLRISDVGALAPGLFTRFIRDFPEVQLEVRSTTRHVDLIAEGVDVAVRFGEVRDPNLIARKVFTDKSVVVGAPSYLKLHGTPQTLQELAGHNCISGFAGEWQPKRTWPTHDGGGVRISGRLAANDISLILAAVRDGLGLALLPASLVRAEIKDKKLDIVLENLVGAATPVSIVYADRDFIEPRVKAFVDRAATEISALMARDLSPQSSCQS